MKTCEATDCITPIDLPCSEPRAVINGGSILGTVDVVAPPERVWLALTTDEVERWWGSDDTYRITQWAADLRLGGHWSLVVRTRDGKTYPAGGTFLKIDAPHKLVQTRKYEWNHSTLGRVATIVTYQLGPIAGGTRVTVRHDGFAGWADAAKEHALDWERFLCWLEAYLRNVN
jgi:uncharacterized protein YndB with AHSA1/START domain